MSKLIYTQNGVTINNELTIEDIESSVEVKKELVNLSDRITVLEDAGGNVVDVKKSTLQFYKQLGQSNTDLKPYCDQLRESMINLEEFGKFGTGLFIHWGVYAVPAGNYTGTKQTGTNITQTSTNYNTEWIMRDLAIPHDTYKAYENQFTAVDWNPETICRLAAEANMGYIVITIKHHDGFSLAPSKYCGWDVRTAAARNTIIDELKTACDKYKLKFGIYVSQYWDWMTEGGFGLNHKGRYGYWNGSSADMYTQQQHITYCNNTVKYINEMVERYNPFILWYDPGTAYSDTYQKIFRDGELENYPQVITNDRLQYDRGVGDYGTGERTIYLRSLKYGEACFTMNDTWGYSDNNESKYYTLEKVFKQFLIYTLSYGQNCLMNIGPKADGSIPDKQIECLNAIKTFQTNYGSFRNYKRVNYKSVPKWGYMLELEGNKVLCYIATKGNPAVQTVNLDCINTTNLVNVEILTPGNNASYTINENCVTVTNLGLDSTTKLGVVRLTYSMEPEHLDANLYNVNENISTRVFPMKQNFTYNFDNYRYQLVPARNSEYTSEFIWNGYSENHNLILNRTCIQDSPISDDDLLTVTITNLNDGTSQIITYSYNQNESETSVALVNGERYQIKMKCTGTVSSTLYNFDSFRFEEEIIIIHPQSITLSEHDLMIAEGGTGQLDATILPPDTTNKVITWTSGNTNVVTVEDGMITCVAPGDTTITVTTVDGGLTDICNIVVTSSHEEDIVNANSFTIVPTTGTVRIGNTLQLTENILPENTTYKNVSWESLNPDIATVENGLVTGLAVGTAVIQGTLIYDNIVATSTITVEPIHPDSITFDTDSINLLPGFKQQIVATILPNNATCKDLVWTSSNTDIAEVTDGLVLAKTPGQVTITASTVDGCKSAVCTCQVGVETYDYLWQVDSLAGTSDQGDDTHIKPFAADYTNWTLFGYVKHSKNPNTDNNATLYQCVVNSSPWTGVRIDADNNNYPTATTSESPMLPRFLAGADWYVNPTNGNIGTKTKITMPAVVHPICFSRDGNTYKVSHNGIDWTELTGLTTAQLNRLIDCELTVGFDYKRQSGNITTTKYRMLKSDYPCCVSIKNQSEYPFYTLYHQYDETL